MPRHDPVTFIPGNEGVKAVQQQLSHCRLSKVIDAAIQPTLEGVRVIGSKCCTQFCQQEQGDVDVLKRGSGVTT